MNITPRTRSTAPATLLAVTGLALAAAAGSANAQLIITNDFTQNGGFLFIPNGPNDILISGAGGPTFRLSNNTVANNVRNVILGTQPLQSGTMILEQNTHMTMVPAGPLNPRLTIGESAASSGTVRVRTGAILDVNGFISIAQAGGGTLIVEDGGQVSARAMSVASGPIQGSVLVTGDDSRLDFSNPDPFSPTRGFTLGGGSQGTMIISDSGVVTTDGNVNVGGFGTGVLTLFDPGSSLLIDGRFTVGAFNGGEGTVNISNGALLTSKDSSIGDHAGFIGPATSNAVTVTGAGSLWANDGYLNLGRTYFDGPLPFSNSGTLNITNNASVTNTGTLNVGYDSSGYLNISGGSTITAAATDANNTVAAYLGRTSAAYGEAVLTGANSAMNLSGDIVVGNTGDGVLRINNGARVTNNNATIGASSGSLGFASVIGTDSRWTNSGNVYLGGTESLYNTNLWGGQSSLFIRDGGVVEAQGNHGLTIFRLSVLVGSNGGTVIANTVENRGSVAMGEIIAPGTLTIAGNYVQTETGNLVVKLYGTEPDTGHDQLIVTNQAMLDGMLSVIVNFALGFNQSFDILTSNNVLIGQFAGLDNNALVGTFNGVDLFIRYSEVEGPAGNGGLVTLYTVPAPGSVVLFTAGLLAFARRRRTLR